MSIKTTDRTAYFNARRLARKVEAMTILGGAFCACCGFAPKHLTNKSMAALQFDHVAGNGAQDRATGGGSGDRAVAAVLAMSEAQPLAAVRAAWQVLCANCNMNKGVDARCDCQD